MKKLTKVKRIGVDVDDVLRDYVGAAMHIFITHYPDYVISPIMKGWDFTNVTLPFVEKFNVIYNEFPEAIFLNSPPVKNAVEDFPILQNWANNKNMRLVCVTAQQEHLIVYCYQWLARHNFVFPELHVTYEKQKVDIDCLIDDSPVNYGKWVDSGRPAENFILFDRTYNQNIDVPNRIYRLSDVFKIIS